MLDSRAEVDLLLQLLGRDDVVVANGAERALPDATTPAPSTGASVADLAPVVDGVDLDRPAGQVEDRARSITPRDRRLVHRLVVLCSWMSRQHPSQQGHEPVHVYDAVVSFTTNHGEPA